MTDSPKCLRCGGADLKAGHLEAEFLLQGQFVPVAAFQLEDGDGLSQKERMLPIKASMCLDCGFVEFSGDPEAAKAVIKRIETD
jgi:hypothetical protein